MYEPFYFGTTQEPELLWALEGEGTAEQESAPETPAKEVILERDGIHYINNRALEPDGETVKTLDQKFLDLVDSVINPASPGAPQRPAG
jgi:hypothetical protein